MAAGVCRCKSARKRSGRRAERGRIRWGRATRVAAARHGKIAQRAERPTDPPPVLRLLLHRATPSLHEYRQQ